MPASDSCLAVNVAKLTSSSTTKKDEQGSEAGALRCQVSFSSDNSPRSSRLPWTWGSRPRSSRLLLQRLIAFISTRLRRRSVLHFLHSCTRGKRSLLPRLRGGRLGSCRDLDPDKVTGLLLLPLGSLLSLVSHLATFVGWPSRVIGLVRDAREVRQRWRGWGFRSLLGGLGRPCRRF